MNTYYPTKSPNWFKKRSTQRILEIFTCMKSAQIPLSDSVFTSRQSSMVLSFPTQPICYFGSRNNDTKLGVFCLVTHTGSNRRRTKECQPLAQGALASKIKTKTTCPAVYFYVSSLSPSPCPT